ncbi:SDR family NAD(P)-dependent oxidoreductase [Sphingomonas sp. SRS2]|uniref:SDR family NAD(P)-dependent oxidoreductase n=1 Tax=Sphingomonas sp. SRS2 TaxID=133190 RepID=UPI000618483B|nr:SDR family oxidoreductase [Sphingomonas sp. SRS2]KKC25228.1 3-oxoacyl-ACP reductase [Sphingomonas sp. SRS2]
MGVLDGKVALVTGGGRGLGRGLALALGSAGASLVVCGRSQDMLDESVRLLEARGVQAMGRTCDLTDLTQIEDLIAAAIDRFGTIDILVNNAQGEHGNGLLLDAKDEWFEYGFRSGPLATFRTMRACHPYLRNGGVIVNLATGAALRPDPIGYGFYGAVKEAIRTLTRTAAVEWAKDGIRAHALIPLAYHEGMRDWAAARPEESKAFFASIPMGRVGDPEQDIGPVMVFLCSDASNYMTGNTMLVDGGHTFLR